MNLKAWKRFAAVYRQASPPSMAVFGAPATSYRSKSGTILSLNNAYGPRSYWLVAYHTMVPFRRRLGNRSHNFGPEPEKVRVHPMG
jgi:hypothetical protein